MPSKSGRHHNRNGLRQIKKGSLAKNTKRLAKRLGIPYRNLTKRVPNVACQHANIIGRDYDYQCVDCGMINPQRR